VILRKGKASRRVKKAISSLNMNENQLVSAVGVLVMIGIGILMATSRTKPRDPPKV